jgi:hypothetical protein
VINERVIVGDGKTMPAKTPLQQRAWIWNYDGEVELSSALINLGQFAKNSPSVRIRPGGWRKKYR